MPDVVSAQKRSEMMAGIRGRDTKPEILIRQALFAEGFRYRLHDRKLPGRPDLVLPKYNAVIFVHGCFWHRHSCHLFRMPGSRKEFWEAKINSNAVRDVKMLKQLQEQGWRTLVIWECSMKGKTRLDQRTLIKKVVSWVRSKKSYSEITGAC